MTYSELIDEFWRQDMIDPIPPLDMKFYFYLLNECKKRQWINPFELQSRITEISLMITRKTIGEVRNRLKQKGLIDFISNNNKPTVYMIRGLAESPDNDSFNCYPQVTIKKHLGLQSRNNNGYNSETFKEIPLKEKSPIPPKEYIPKELDNNNYNSSSRTREEIEIDRFDDLLQEIVDGKWQQWEDEMCKKHRIDSVIDYLPSFRSHAIANSKLSSIHDMNDLKYYFNVSFRFFTRVNPIELLGQYEKSAVGDNYKKFCIWIAKENPNVARGVIPLSEDEFKNLLDLYDKQRIFDAIRDLNEREDLIAKYFSLYRTLLKWLKDER